MLVISKFCLIFSCLFLASCGFWQDWNNNPVLTSASSTTIPPTKWIRTRSVNSPLYDLNVRYNQYTYIFNMTGH